MVARMVGIQRAILELKRINKPVKLAPQRRQAARIVTVHPVPVRR